MYRTLLALLLVLLAVIPQPGVALADDPSDPTALFETLLGPGRTGGAPPAAATPQPEQMADNHSTDAGVAQETERPQAPVPPSLIGQPVRAPILFFHEIPSQRTFETIVTGLMAAGYTPVPLQAIADRLVGRPVQLPPRPIAFTFDDGLRSQYQNAYPVLAKYALPATFFVIPTYQDGVHRYMTEDEWRELVAAGMRVESHTFSHSSLGAANAGRVTPLLRDIRDSRSYLEQALRGVDPAYQVRFFAYPNGSYSGRVTEMVAESGYDAAFSTQQRSTHQPSQRFALGRVRADGLSLQNLLAAIART